LGWINLAQGTDRKRAVVTAAMNFWFLISDFRRLFNVICFLLRCSPACELQPFPILCRTRSDIGSERVNSVLHEEKRREQENHNFSQKIALVVLFLFLFFSFKTVG
jgi:hypothetical protein